MFFKRKKVIDLAELQKKGFIKPPTKKEKEIKIDKQGFVDVSALKKETSPDPFFLLGSENTQNKDISIESDFYKKREVDRRIEELDNKIYKLEQRIELLERKLGTNNYSSY